MTPARAALRAMGVLGVAGLVSRLGVGSGEAKSKKKDDPAAYGLVVIDVKKLLKADPSQNVALNPGDQILVPEKEPK